MRVTRPIPAILLALIAVAAAGCGGDSEPEPPDTALARAMETFGDGGSPTGAGFGWADFAAAAKTPSALQGLGPATSDLFDAAARIRRVTGLDVSQAQGAVSSVTSYTLGVRLDGVDGTALAKLLDQKAEDVRHEGDTTYYDVGTLFRSMPEYAERAGIGLLGARVAVRDHSVVLARVDQARARLLGGGEPLVENPSFELAAECLGDVAAARIQPASFTYQPRISPDLLAVGQRDDGTGMLCAIDDSEELISGAEAALEKSFAPGAQDAVTEEPMRRLVESADVERVEGDGVHAVRATIDPAPGAPPGFAFAALARGSALTYLGAPPPFH